ncbi:MAG: ABC transporter ATP-binding protein [Sporolactobacillus sp.]
MSYLTIEALSLELGGKQILKNLDLSIEKGELVTLLGPSGCGKSTLLRAISGLTAINQGKILIDGQNIAPIAPRKREIGMVFQSYALFPNLTVYDNVAFGLTMRHMDKATISGKVTEILDIVGLTDKADAFPSELSGGQQQRVALARAVVAQPKVLLLDEPLSALDAQIRKQLRQEICRLQKRLGITMIFVTHDQEEAMAISDRIFIMHDGQIAQQGTPEAIYFHPNSPFVAGFIGNYNTLSQASAADLFGMDEKLGTQSLYALRPEAITFTSREGAGHVSGTVIERHILGNIIRYLVRTEYGDLFVDQMSEESSSVRNAQEVTLYISQADIVDLGIRH